MNAAEDIPLWRGGPELDDLTEWEYAREQADYDEYDF